MRDDDAIRIRHMLDAAREAIGFASGRTSEELDQDRMLLLSLVKCVEILLIHGYFDIDTTIV